MEAKYDRHASMGSKRSIFTFIVTFIVCLFLFDNSASLFAGSIFVLVGMLTVSVAIAMPFYFYKKNHGKVSSLVSLIEISATILLTIIFFSYFFSNSVDFTATISEHNKDNPYIVRCEQPLPAFTLGPAVIPSKIQSDKACSCIWNELTPSAKNLSAFLVRNESHGATDKQLRLFLYSLGVATEVCSREML
jgi:hypothetical protein